MSEVEERPRLVTAGYGLHRSQWVEGATSRFAYLEKFTLNFSSIKVSVVLP